MPQNLRPEFNTSLANQFVKEIQLLKSNIYFFLGKVSKWNNNDVPPTVISDTLETDIEARDNLLYMARVTPNDASLCTTRNEWLSGKMYPRWNSEVNMKNSKFFVVNSVNAVYKCLDNNNNGLSTFEPTGTAGYVTFRTSDDYLWKYMYTIPQFKSFKFSNASYIPVQRAVSDAFYNKGAIQEVIIQNGGTGYTSVPMTTLTVGGPGVGAVVMPVINEAGTIIKVNIVNGGTGYVTEPDVTIAGAGTKKYPETIGSDAKFRAIVSGGVLQHVLIIDPGISYVANSSTAIVVKGDGQGAKLSPVIFNGSVVDVVINSPGSGYSYAEVIIPGNAKLAVNIGFADLFSDQSTVEQLSIPGAIYAANITNPGAKYQLGTPPNVTISGDGIGATAVAIMSNDKVTDLKMITFGHGYTYAKIEIDPSPTLQIDGGINATGSIIKTPFGGHGFDAVNELYGDVICISSVLSADSMINEISQDYRQYGLIKNPRNIGSAALTNVNKALLCYKVRILSTVGLIDDMELNINGFRYIVVKFDATFVYLQPISNTTIPPLGTLSDANSSLKFTVIEILSSPTINKYSGELLLSSTELPFTFTTEQSIALKTYIKC